MLEAYHHSGDCRFRQHPRALKTGEQTILRLWTGGTQVRSVLLRLYRDGKETALPALPVNGYWEVAVAAPAESGVLWYDFVIRTAEGEQYYGAEPGETAGPGRLYEEAPCAFQLTVQEADFHTPDWAKNGILYQIFPDRFRQGDPENIKRGLAYRDRMKRQTVLHQSWEEEALYLPLEGEQYYAPIDFYGGDFAGMTEELPRLKAMGVTVLYLNPISEALSNHRYDTADYHRPDPFLGTGEDFARFTAAAEKMGMRVLLDGVYSHTGADSIYFNQAESYPTLGAWQGERSPYYKWYTFSEDKTDYKCWWGFHSLPEVEEHAADWQEFVISGEDSVLSDWMQKGASGFRLDVADELPDDVITMIRHAIKKKDHDSFLIGEVWEDATTKQSYGENRRYALGDGLDSVMNYPFRNACVGYLLGWQSAVQFRRLLLTQQVNYPQEMYYTLMNLLSSHDIPRLRTVLALGSECEALSREEQAKVVPDAGQDIHGGILQRLAAAVCYSIPGLPAVYYGDEYGMHGLKDPFNRRPLKKQDPATEAFYQRLAALRNSSSALRTGFAQFHATENNLMAIHRFLIGGRDVFGTEAAGADFLLVVNPDPLEKRCEITLLASGEGIDAPFYEQMSGKRYHTLTDLDTNEEVSVESNRLSVTIPPESVKFFQIHEEN